VVVANSERTREESAEAERRVRAKLTEVMPLCYGFGAKAIAAWLGTGVSLLLAVGLAEAFTHLAHLAGTASEEALYLSGVLKTRI
jgi:uncharacterized membrane protein